MNLRTLLRAGALSATVCALLWPASESNLAHDVRSLFSVGAWDQALTLLEQASNAQADPATRELLAMAYLYTADRLDSPGNLDKATSLMKEIVGSGGKAHFFVSQGHDAKKQKNLLEATPGELTVSTTSVEFEPQDGSGSHAQHWEKKDITECALNPQYGKSTNSFHLLAARNELDFRPLHFSAEESNLICSLIAVAPPPAASPQAAQKKR